MHCRLRDMNVTVRADDERVLEVLASGLPLHHGAQLAVDITLRSVLTSAGLPSPNAAHVDVTRRGSTESCSKEIAANWSWLESKLGADGARRRANSSIPWLLPGHVMHLPSCAVQRIWRGSADG